MSPSAGGARILYDAGCGFCRWSLGWLLRWDRRHALEPIAIQDPAAAELLAPIEPAGRLGSWHLVDGTGELSSAGAAASPLLRLLPGGAAAAWLCERAPGLVERAYAAVARARGVLGRLLTAGAVARADRLIAARQAARTGDRLP